MARTNEEQLELFADLLEPAAEFLADAEFVGMLQSGKAPIKAAAFALLAISALSLLLILTSLVVLVIITVYPLACSRP